MSVQGIQAEVMNKAGELYKGKLNDSNGRECFPQVGILHNIWKIILFIVFWSLNRVGANLDLLV